MKNLRVLASFFAVLGLIFANTTYAKKPATAGAHIEITKVFVRDASKTESLCFYESGVPNEIIAIHGLNFPDENMGDPDPIVSLGDSEENPLIVCGSTPNTILVICPTLVVPGEGFTRFRCHDIGDFRLTVMTPKSSASYDLTIGAVGPEGPQGPEGQQGPPGPQGPAGTATECPCFTFEDVLLNSTGLCEVSMGHGPAGMFAASMRGADDRLFEALLRFATGGSIEEMQCSVDSDVTQLSTQAEALKCVQNIRAVCVSEGLPPPS